MWRGCINPAVRGRLFAHRKVGTAAELGIDCQDFQGQTAGASASCSTASRRRRLSVWGVVSCAAPLACHQTQMNSYLPSENLFKNMPVAVLLVFITVTHQRNGASSPERLKQTKAELLPVILNSAVAAVDRAILKQFSAVAACKLAPSNPPLLSIAEQRFARPKIGHPHVVPARGHTTAAKTCHEDAHAVFAWFYG